MGVQFHFHRVSHISFCYAYTCITKRLLSFLKMWNEGTRVIKNIFLFSLKDHSFGESRMEISNPWFWALKTGNLQFWDGLRSISTKQILQVWRTLAWLKTKVSRALMFLLFLLESNYWLLLNIHWWLVLDRNELFVLKSITWFGRNFCGSINLDWLRGLCN